MTEIKGTKERKNRVMSKEIKTKYSIGDLVYLASEDKVDREVVKAIKVVGLKHKISYGVKNGYGGSLFSMFYSGNDYTWYSGADIFATEEDAEHRQADLKAKAEAKEKQAELKEIARMEEQLQRDKENLRRKKKGLPPLDDDEEDDW